MALDFDHLPACFCCDCQELIVGGARASMPTRHSCEYVQARNKLIPQAVKIANGKVRIDSPEAGNRWTREFAQTMDLLSAPLLNGKR